MNWAHINHWVKGALTWAEWIEMEMWEREGLIEFANDCSREASGK